MKQNGSKKTVSKLKSLYCKFEVETAKYKKKDVEALEKQFALPLVLKEYYLKIGDIDPSIEMEAYEMYDLKSVRMFTEKDYKAVKFDYKGDFLVFATEIAGVCEFAIRKEDLVLENPPLYTSLLELAPDDSSYWIPATTYNTEEECFDTVLDFLYEIAKSISVDPDPRNNPKNIQLVKDVLQGKRPETDITPEVVKDVTKLTDLSEMEFKNFRAIRKLVNLFELYIFKCEGVDFDPVLALAKLSILAIRKCDITINAEGIEKLAKLKRLDFSVNRVQNISHINNLLKLDALQLSDCGLNDISFVVGMRNLILLEANNNQIESLPVFEEKNKIATLYLNNNRLTNLANIQALTSLESLEVMNNPLTDVSALKTLKKLDTINVSNCLLSNLSFLSDKEHIHTLYANNNRIKSLPELTVYNKFGTLQLRNNQIEDITPLIGVGYLFHLKLEGNPLKDISAINNITKLNDITVNKEMDIPESDAYIIKQYTDCQCIQLE